MFYFKYLTSIRIFLSCFLRGDFLDNYTDTTVERFTVLEKNINSILDDCKERSNGRELKEVIQDDSEIRERLEFIFKEFFKLLTIYFHVNPEIRA